MDVLKIIIASLLSIAALFIITRLMGHKQVAQLDFFDYVSGITIGSIGAELATELDSPERPLIALLIYGIISFAINLATEKFPKLRKYANGTPTILMDEGKLYRKNLSQAKLDLSEFMLMCREAGYFDLDEIQTAVFEHNGRLSILPRAAFRPATPSNLKIPVKAVHIGVEVIMDGRIMGENLTRMGLGEEWLRGMLQRRGYGSERDIFLAIYHKEEDRLSIYPNE